MGLARPGSAAAVSSSSAGGAPPPLYGGLKRKLALLALCIGAVVWYSSAALLGLGESFSTLVGTSDGGAAARYYWRRHGAVPSLDDHWGQMPWTPAVAGDTWGNASSSSTHPAAAPTPARPPRRQRPPPLPPLADQWPAGRAAPAPPPGAWLPPLEPAVAPLARPPALRSAADPGVSALLALLDEVVATGLTWHEAREGYMTALKQLSHRGEFRPLPDPFGAAQPAQSAAHRLLSRGLQLLAGTRRLAPCGPEDRGLDQGVRASTGKYLLAGALVEAEETLPHLVTQLLTWAMGAEPGTLYLSLQESGGGEGAARWLDVLRVLLVPLRTPTRIVAGAANTTRGEDELPIDFMARLRNAAVAPFFDAAARRRLCSTATEGAVSFTGTSGGESSSPAAAESAAAPAAASPSTTDSNGEKTPPDPDTTASAAAGDSDSGGDGRRALAVSGAGAAAVSAHPACFAPDWVLSLDASFFCQGDLLRLLQYRSADLACGMDVAPAERDGDNSSSGGGGGGRRLAEKQQQQRREKGEEQEKQQQQQQRKGRRQQQQQQHQQQQEEGEETGPALQDQQRQRQQVSAGGDGDEKADDGFLLQDVWTARDVSGRTLYADPPYAVHAASRRRAAAGLPFQVYCCFSGLSKIRASVFDAGLRYRGPRTAQSECSASEGALLCDDMYRLKYRHAVMDPGIRPAYRRSDASEVDGWRRAGVDRAGRERKAAAAKAAADKAAREKKEKEAKAKAEKAAQQQQQQQQQRVAGKAAGGRRLEEVRRVEAEAAGEVAMRWPIPLPVQWQQQQQQQEEMQQQEQQQQERQEDRRHLLQAKGAAAKDAAKEPPFATWQEVEDAPGGYWLTDAFDPSNVECCDAWGPSPQSKGQQGGGAGDTNTRQQSGSAAAGIEEVSGAGEQPAGAVACSVRDVGALPLPPLAEPVRSPR